MTEEVKDAVQEGVEEPVAPPVPDVSAGSTEAGSAQPSLDADVIVERLFEKLDPVLDNKVDARFKSGKDVRFSKVDEIYEWVKASGGDPEKIRGALAETELRNRIDILEAERGSAGAVGAATGGALQDKTAEFLLKKQDELGITLSNEELQELVDSRRWPSDQGEMAAEWYGELSTQLVKKAKQGGVTAAATVSRPGTTAAPIEGGDYHSLAAELAGLRGKYDETSSARRTEIQAAMDNVSEDEFNVV